MKAKVNEILESFARFVSTEDHAESPILTAYVDVDPSKPGNQRAQPAWEIELKNEAKRLRDELGEDALKRATAAETWDRTETALMQAVRERQPTGRSVVYFSDLETSISIDLPVEMETRLYFGFPQVKHLLFALDQYKKYLVVLVSGDKLRFASIFLARNTGEVQVDTGHESKRLAGSKASTLAKDRRDAEFERRFIADVAQEIQDHLFDDPSYERIVIGGNARQAHAVVNALHPAVQALVVSIEAIDFRAADQSIAEAVTKVAEGYEAEHDLEVVEQLVSISKRGGPALLDREGIETALAHGQVRMLVLAYPIDREVFDPLIAMASRSGASVEFVSGAAADRLSEFGGVGASLYYA